MAANTSNPLAQAYDGRRTAYLSCRGIKVLRFTNDLVFRELPGVLDAIALALGVADPSP